MSAFLWLALLTSKPLKLFWQNVMSTILNLGLKAQNIMWEDSDDQPDKTDYNVYNKMALTIIIKCVFKHSVCGPFQFVMLKLCLSGTIKRYL